MNSPLVSPPARNWKALLRAVLTRGWDRLRRSGRFEIALLLAILLTVTGFWIFASLASEVMEGDTDQFDNHILTALRQPGHPDLPIGPHWTLQVARDLTALGSVSGLGIVTGVVCGYLLLRKRYSLFWFVLASVVSGTVLGLVLKEVINRPRPASVSHLTDISTASFPSGHSMLSSVVYLTLAALLGRAVPDWKTKIYFLAVAVSLIVLIGFSRVYLGVHFPTDVLAGWCIGCAWAILCCLAAHFLAQRRMAALAEAAPR